MLNHKRHITQLFFWTWYLKLAKLTDQSHLFKQDLLADKLEQYLFFYKVKAEVFPSYHFWSLIFMIVGNFFASWDPETLARKENEFLKDEEKFLKENIYEYITYWRHFPQMFRDFWSYYPRYGVSFDNIECIYIDIWSELPKAIDSLLGELLVRDMPLRAKIPAKPFEVAISRIAATIMITDVLPPVKEGVFTNEELSKHIIDYILGEDAESAQISLQVISFYLKARPQILEECSSALMAKKLIVNEVSLMNYFLGEYIFKGVSNEAKRFFVANSDLMEKNPFKVQREQQLAIWNRYSEREHQAVITGATSTLKKVAVQVAFENSLTVEERAERHRKLIAELEAEDFESLPRVSLSKLIEMGEQTTPEAEQIFSKKEDN